MGSHGADSDGVLFSHGGGDSAIPGDGDSVLCSHGGDDNDNAITPSYSKRTPFFAEANPERVYITLD